MNVLTIKMELINLFKLRWYIGENEYIRGDDLALLICYGICNKNKIRNRFSKIIKSCKYENIENIEIEFTDNRFEIIKNLFPELSRLAIYALCACVIIDNNDISIRLYIDCCPIIYIFNGMKIVGIRNDSDDFNYLDLYESSHFKKILFVRLFNGCDAVMFDNKFNMIGKTKYMR